MKHLLALTLLTSLSGCAALAGGVRGATIATVGTIAATVSPIVNDSAKVACAVQAVANDLGAQLPTASRTAAAISSYAGQVCVW